MIEWLKLWIHRLITRWLFPDAEKKAEEQQARNKELKEQGEALDKKQDAIAERQAALDSAIEGTERIEREIEEKKHDDVKADISRRSDDDILRMDL